MRLTPRAVGVCLCAAVVWAGAAVAPTLAEAAKPLSPEQRAANKRARARARAAAQAKQDAALARRAVRQPSRLTAGDSDQFLGIADRAGQQLIYVTNRNATAQLEARPLAGGAARVLLDDGADVSFPRPSPDGRRLLFISHRDDAAGDLCVVDLSAPEDRPSRVVATNRRCLTDAKTGEAQAFWFPDSRHIGAVVRDGIHGDYELRRFDADGGVQRGKTMLKRNLSSPTLSPDGRWLAYVPVVRRSDEVGVSFAMQAGDAIALVRLDKPGAVQKLKFDLPGTSGFPAFSPDGRFLYFSQYLNDTNFDGSIDGDDSAVLFRAPFRPDAARPVDSHPVEQLSSARLNCQYPVPNAKVLLMTCDVGGSLDVFALPPDGAVPATWDAAKTREALATAVDPWDRLMLLTRLSERAGRGTAPRVAALREMAWLHLTLGEFVSAGFYAAQAGTEVKGDKEAFVWATLIAALIKHRTAERQLDRGRLTAAFVQATEARIASVQTLAGAATSDDNRALGALVRAELYDAIGREARALEQLAEVKLGAVRAPVVLHLYGASAVRLLRDVGRRDAALDAIATLSRHEALQERERVRYAEAWLRLLLRGQGQDSRRALVAAAIPKHEPESAIGMMLSAEAELLEIGRKEMKAVRDGLQKTYQVHNDLARRKALVRRAIVRGADLGEPALLYHFGGVWVSALAPTHSERAGAEAIFRDGFLEQAWLAYKGGNFMDARAQFFAVTRQTSSLQAWAGFCEARFREGHHDAFKTVQRLVGRKDPDDGAWRFVQAWLIARNLLGPEGDAPGAVGEGPPPDDATVLARIRAAKAHLDVASRTRRDDVELHALYGYLAQQELLLTGDKDASLEALTHYRLALALAEDNVRYRAPLHLALGWMQAAVGNHWLAVEHFEARQALPFLAPTTRLSLLWAKARSLYRIDKDKDAAAAAQEALSLVEQTPALRRYLPLALDRAALTALAAARFDAALAALDKLAPQVAKLPAEERGWQELKRRTSRAMAALGAGRHAEAVADAEGALALLAEQDDKQPLVAGIDRDAMRYRHVDYLAALHGIAGLALDAQGKHAAAAEALSARVAALDKRQGARERTGDLPELADARLRLASVLARVRGPAAAAPVIAAARADINRFAQEAGTAVDPVRLRVLRAALLLHLHHDVDAAALGGDLTPDIEAIHEALTTRRNPQWTVERTLFATWRAALALRSGEAKP